MKKIFFSANLIPIKQEPIPEVKVEVPVVKQEAPPPQPVQSVA